MPIIKKPRTIVVPSPPPPESAPLPSAADPYIIVDTDPIAQVLSKLLKKRAFAVTIERDNDGFIRRLRITEE